MTLSRFTQTEFYHKHKYRIERLNDLVSFLSALCLILFIAGDQSYLAQKRHALSNEIRLTALVTGLQTGIFAIDAKVQRALARVPRHHFLERAYERYAYYNIALPEKHTDTVIPEPFVTAMMIHLMDIGSADRVLDIGYGTGYSAAVMAKLAGKVYAIEQAAPLKRQSAYKPAETHGYDNVRTRRSDGSHGWREAGPFDSILVRQAMTAPPANLLAQLKPGGRLVIPIGPAKGTQRLMVYQKSQNGHVRERSTLFLKISPLLQGHVI